MREIPSAVWDVIYTTASLLWMAAWALVLGYAFSSAIQVFVKPAEAADRLGGGGVREVGFAAGLGFISSSCSFAALAARLTAGRDVNLAEQANFELNHTLLLNLLAVAVAAVLLGFRHWSPERSQAADESP